MKMTRAETAAWLAQRDDFCILSHCRPDGDTVGSTAALCLGLRKMGKKAYVLENPELSGKLQFLHEGLTKTAPEAGDTIVSVDVSARSRLLRGAEDLPVALRIDHHGVGESFADLELVDGDVAACGEIVYDLLVELGIGLDQQIGTALYVAVSTDTGCFRFANTTADTFKVAAACAATGAKLYPINQMLFDTNSLTKLKVQSWMVASARFFRDGKIALCAMPYAVEAEASPDDMDNVSGFLRSIEGVEICALIRETEGGVKLSVRAIPGYDASAVCARFGGGGHKGASGASFSMSLKEAEAAVEKVLLEMY
ncbi:MAG: DHH family phosphoesterase [Oscillospiraceae bacterium]|nr:DHH family phosphoesterase [Oscillospiraceae bacterium]